MLTIVIDLILFPSAYCVKLRRALLFILCCVSQFHVLAIFLHSSILLNKNENILCNECNGDYFFGRYSM